MAIQKEIWARDIQEGFFPDNSFAAKSVNDDAFVEGGKKVHVPNAGAPSGVSKNRSNLPGQVAKRVDTDVNYDLDEFTTDPVLIPNADTVELSYDKRQSVISQDRQELIHQAHKSLLASWAPAAAFCVNTTGSGNPAHQTSATGNRKAVTTADILNLMTKFNADDIPQEGRYLLLDAQMYAELLDSMTNTDKIGFFQLADAAKGVIGQIYGFNVLTPRSSVLRYAVANGAATALATTEAATDCAAGLAWHQSCVRRALGEVKVFEETDSPSYYGDVLSFLVRCGGSKSRYDSKGVYALVGITAEDEVEDEE